MPEPHIVTPEEAQEWVSYPFPPLLSDLVHTVATEHKRREEYTRAAVVKALRGEAARAAKAGNVWAAEWNDDAADNYENETQA